MVAHLAHPILRASADAYLRTVLARLDVPRLQPLLARVFHELATELADWAGSHLISISPSGSIAKGTAVLGQTDLDVFVSLRPTLELGLKDIYLSLLERLRACGFAPRQQDVSIGIQHRGVAVDITVGRQHPSAPGYHSIYRSRAATWTQTNVAVQADHVRRSGRQSEIRLLKIWRRQKGIEFPSFLLELAAMDALGATASDSLSENLQAVFRYLAVDFVSARLVDPSNTNNVASEDLSRREKTLIAVHAMLAYKATRWSDVLR